MKILIIVILSAVLILTHKGGTPFNNSEPTKPVVTKTMGQPRTKRTEQPVKKAETVATTTATTPTATVQQPLTNKQSLMQQAGIPRSDWGAVDYIVSHESSWNAGATNVSSGAHGLCQALPASKMASAGADYMTNPVTQLRWCHHYALNRYSSWWSAFAFWQVNRWW